MYRLWRANRGCTRGPLFIEYTEERLRKKEREDKRERGSCRCEGKHTGEEKPKQSGKIAK